MGLFAPVTHAPGMLTIAPPGTVRTLRSTTPHEQLKILQLGVKVALASSGYEY
jgi:hypothetical protein